MIEKIRVIKKNKNLLCYSFVENGKQLFSKIVFINGNEKTQTEFDREVSMNTYLSENLENKTYHVDLIQIMRNVDVPDYLADVFDTKFKCNILIYAYCGRHNLRYYINRVSQKTFDNLLLQLREATNLLKDIHVMHYDLYCQSNIMVSKEKNKFRIKIVDYGLAYIDDTDETDSDYETAIESIICFNKKQKM